MIIKSPFLLAALIIYLFCLITGSMAARRRRKPPLQDAIEYAVKAQDKTAELEVKYINYIKGTLFVCSYYTFSVQN